MCWKNSTMYLYPGDALAIYPQNNPAEVVRLLSALRYTGDEKVPAPKFTYHPKPGELQVTLLRLYRHIVWTGKQYGQAYFPYYKII